MDPDGERKYSDLKKEDRLIFLNSKKERHFGLLKLKSSKEKPRSPKDSSELLSYSVLLKNHFYLEALQNYLEFTRRF